MEALVAIILLFGVFSQETDSSTSKIDDAAEVALATTPRESREDRASMPPLARSSTVGRPRCTPGHRRVIYRDLSRAGAATVTSESIHSTKCHGVCPDE